MNNIIAICDGETKTSVVKVMVPPDNLSLSEAENQAEQAVQQARDEYQLDEAYIAILLEKQGWQFVEFSQIDLEKYR